MARVLCSRRTVARMRICSLSSFSATMPMMLRVPMSSAKIGSPSGFFFVPAVEGSTDSFLTVRFVVFLAAAFVPLARVLLVAVLAAGFLPRFLAAGFAVSLGASSAASFASSFAATAAVSSALAAVSSRVFAASGAAGAAVCVPAVSVSLGGTLSPEAASETMASVVRSFSSFVFAEVFLVLGIE